MKPLFVNTHFQKQLDHNGFVKMPLLNHDKVSAILQLSQHYFANHNSQTGFRSTSDTLNRSLIHNINLELRKIVLPAFEKHLQHFNLVLSTFLIKDMGVNTAQPPHEDWTYTDEQHFFSCNAWIALQDVDIANGCMWFIPKSHLLMHTLRASPNHPWAYAKCISAMEKFKVYMPIKAGECLVFFHKTIHGSPPNFSNKPRIAVGNCIIENNAPLYHYYYHNNASLVQYHLHNDDYIDLNKNLPPASYIKKENVHYDFSQLEPAVFIKKLQSHAGLLQKIKNFF